MTASRWQLATTTRVRTNTGGVRLDLSRAEFDGPVIDLEVVANTGGVTLFVPRGVSVQILSAGSVKNKLGDDDPLPGAPLIRLRAKTNTGGIALRRPKTPARRWWQRRQKPERWGGRRL